ncbi:Hypothetical protein DHA2_101955 [Giardia duodenalis]|uniref:Uncharacterized protein n=1 Tax=Giardia intestinalis TaxID=5741 RepID=V6TG43_GIAIN|nr:Hypothetical protein DHA2_101955 [Giardia intestinalis]
MLPSFICSTNDSIRSFMRTWTFRCAFVTILCNTFLSMVFYACMPQVYDRTPVTTLFLFLSPFLTSCLYYSRNSSLGTPLVLVFGFLFTLELLHLEPRVAYTSPNSDVFTLASRFSPVDLTWLESTDALVYALVTVLFTLFLRSIVHAKGTLRLTSPYYIGIYAGLRHSIKVTLIFILSAAIRWTILFSCVAWLLNLLVRNAPSTIAVNYHMIYYLVLPSIAMIRFVAVFHGALVSRPIDILERPDMLLPVSASLSIGFGAQTYDLLARRVAEILAAESDVMDATNINAIAVQFGESGAEARRRTELFSRLGEAKPGQSFAEMARKRFFHKRSYVPDRYRDQIPCFYIEDVRLMHTILSSISRSLYIVDWNGFSATFNRANSLAQEAQVLSLEVTQGCCHYGVPPAYLKDLLPLHIYSYNNSCPGCLLYLFDFLIHSLLATAARMGVGDIRFYGGWYGYVLGDKEARDVKRLSTAIINVQRKLYNITASEPITDMHKFFVDLGATYANAAGPGDHFREDMANNDELIDDMIGLDFLIGRDNTTGLILDDAGIDFMMLNDGALGDIQHSTHPALNVGQRQTAQFEHYSAAEPKASGIRHHKFAVLMAILIGKLSIEEIIKHPEVIDSYTLGALLRRLWSLFFDSLGSLTNERNKGGGKGFSLLRLKYVFRTIRAVQRQQASFDADAEIASIACDTLQDYLSLIENTSLFFVANEIVAESLKVLYSSLVMYRKKARVSRENLGHSRRLMASLRLLADRIVVTPTVVN